MSAVSSPSTDGPLSGKRVALVGRWGSMSQREAQRLLKEQRATVVDAASTQIDVVVVGADALPLADGINERLRQWNHDEAVEVVTETELWERLGYLPAETRQVQLYTPAMLAELLDVPLRIIRRWHRRGLIVPAREVHRLPYFDFQEISTARRLAQLLAAGASPDAIEKKIGQLIEFIPSAKRPLAQLSVIVQGRDILLRDGEGLVDATGQRHFDFDATSDLADSNIEDQDESPHILSLNDYVTTSELTAVTREELVNHANTLEESGKLAETIDAYRTVLAVFGPDAEINFQIAELLYRSGDVAAARERYFMTLEIDDDYVEARANLGCVLLETGEMDLAIAAFQGTLNRHPDYPDVHYHLARTYEELGQPEDAFRHWSTFLELSPENPWADEARDRLGIRS